jgi:hypothetical protein
MYCPQCKAEYRVGFTQCSDCHVALVDHLPVERPVEHEPDVQFVVIRTYPSVIEADLAKNALGAAGIKSMVRAEGAVRRNYLGLDLHTVELFVRADEAEDADRILVSDATNGVRD